MELIHGQTLAQEWPGPSNTGPASNRKTIDKIGTSKIQVNTKYFSTSQAP
jgi:hypothetical protein